MFEIENHTLKRGGNAVRSVASPNHGGLLKPKILVMHYTASGPDADIAAYFAKAETKVSAHLVVARDGSVTQCVSFDRIAWHAGKSRWTGRDGTAFVGLNSHAIGIELENWGPLKKSANGWRSWTGESVDARRTIEARHKFGTPNGGWEVFSEAQLDAAADAARAICAAYGIAEIVGHDDIAPGRKSDPGPAFDMEAFRAKVFGEAAEDDAILVVRSPSGLNLRVGPGAGYARLEPSPLADGTQVTAHEAHGAWRYVSPLAHDGVPERSGWVHGAYLREAPTIRQ